MNEKEKGMKTKKYVKTAVAGISAVAMGATSILSAVPAMAAEQELNKEVIAANDYVLYTANCGTSDPTVVPNEGQERMGLFQSSVDQAYGADSQTGRVWGLSPDTEYSVAKKHADNADDIGYSYVYMGEEAKFDKYKSTLGYDFEVFDKDEKIEGIKSDTYEVTVAFKHFWDGRSVNIQLENETVATDVSVGYNRWVSRTFITKVTDGELNVDISSPRRTSTKQDPILNFVKVRAVEDTEKEVQTYESITGTAGAPMYDTNGNQIQAHGGQIQKLTVDGVEKYYWIGEDKTNDYRPVGGVHVYSSTDLYNWDDEGIVLRTMENPDQFENDEYFKALYGDDYRPVGGVHVYSSTDLYNWDDEGIVLRTMENPDQFENDEYFKALYGDLSEEEKEKIFVDLDKNNTVMERPKMLYNDKTGKYVIWFHADGRYPGSWFHADGRYPGSDADYGKAKAGVAISDSPTGPFKLLGSYKLHHAGDNYGFDGESGIGSVRDMNLFKDDDGAISDSPTGPFKLLGSYKLHHAGDNYGFDGESGIGSVRDMNLFKDDDGQAYVIYSSEGNETTYISKLNEDYTNLAKPQGEAVEGVDFTRNFPKCSREAPAMFKYKDKYYMVNSGCTGWSPNPAQYAVADNPMGPWTGMGDPCTDWGSNTTYDTQSTCVFPVDAEAGKYIYMGDRWNAGDLSESRYVWLPVEFQEGNKIALRRYENWTLDELNDKGSFEIVTEIPEIANSAEELLAALPEKVTISNETTETEHTVTWSTDGLKPGMLGTVTVKGTLDNGREVSHKAQVVNPNTVYFFDSNAKKSEYFDAVKESAGENLLNTQPDQKYTEETKGGYTSVLESEDGNNFDMGTYDGSNMWSNGYWAAENKTIDYAFTLEPGTYNLAAGFQEWWAGWTEYRGMKVTVSQNDKVLAEQECSLGDEDLQIAQEFAVEEAGLVTVSISKTGGGDPVLSWIGITGQKTENPEPEKEADKTSLNNAILMAEKMEKEQEENKCYTAESWAKVAEALKAAREIAEDKNAEQKTVDEAFLNLITACSTLESVTEKVGLKAAIEGAEAILADEENLSKYTAESVEAVRTALEEAKAVLNDEAADQEMINKVTTNLLTAVNSMMLEPEEEVKQGWIETEDGWTYYEDGKKVTAWKAVDGKWYYFNENGIMQTGWVSVEGHWYYLNTDGSMETGWVSVGGHWYHLNESGAMETGWVSVGGYWYYLNADGSMETGWVLVGGHWYYLNESGAMETGWVSVGGYWYYLNEDGTMETGWVSVGGHWYYLNENGTMETSRGFDG